MLSRTLNFLTSVWYIISDRFCFFLAWLFRLVYCKRVYNTDVRNAPYLNQLADVAIVNPFSQRIIKIPRNSSLARSHYLHELCHVKQVRSLGAVKFTLKYILYSIRFGYINNPFEVEARSYADQNK
jgi:hypothetical protein